MILILVAVYNGVFQNDTREGLLNSKKNTRVFRFDAGEGLTHEPSPDQFENMP